MADILLVYPKAGHDVRGVSVNAPLALLTVAAALLDDFSVEILDQRACDDFWGSLEKALAKKPLLLGITSMTGTQIYHGLEISKFAKERSSVPVVWGGMHPTILAAQTVAKPYIDFVIRGEGEESLKLLAGLIAHKSARFEDVPGLVWKKNGLIYSTPAADPLDLDQSPKLPWHLVNAEEYTSPTQFLYPGVKRLLPYQGSRGCPYKCTFCSEPALTKRYRMMNPTKMIAECMEMVEKFKLDNISFFDEEFFVNVRWANEVAEAINGRFTWWAQTRAADLLKMDLKKLERCGLLIVAPGLESGSNRVLEFIKKRETVEEYKKANAQIAQTKIMAQYNFIVGYPTETAQEVDETVALVLHLLDTNPKAIVNQLSPLTPLPGTELLHQAVNIFRYKAPERLEGWIQITRGKQERAWLDPAALRRVRFLYYTSFFLSSVERYSQKFLIPQWLLKLYGRTVYWRWKFKLYWMDWEVPLVRLVFRWIVNPIDYTLPADYGDSHAAKETDIQTVPIAQSPIANGNGVHANGTTPSPLPLGSAPPAPRALRTASLRERVE